ncbi:starch-binding domain-containing protein 1 [Bufo bufo]|uniref:starch-binding domain-containing protein 1 n=1 Tax=Bufo bufo TaxID=8384 RepID=UPI001ABE3DDB|nr:starch-binding domain-containing protein 1 [Bufo bufo]
MWPALVLGILTAIFAWIWYRGGEEAKDPETQEQKPEELAVTPEADQEGVGSEPGHLPAHLASRESSLPSGDHDGCELNTTGQEVPCLRFQKNKAVNPETCQAKNEQKSELQGKDQEGLAVVDHLESGLQVQRPETTNVPTLTDQQSNAPASELPGNIQEHPSDVPKEEELQKEHPSDVPNEEELQKEHPSDVPKEEELQKEHPSDVPKEEELQKEHPSDVPKEEELQKEHPPDHPKEEALQADLGGLTTDVLKKEPHGNIKEHPTDLPIKEVLQADIQEHPTDTLRIEKLQVDMQEHPTDVPAKEELPADTQQHPPDVPKKDELAIILERQTVFPVKGNNLLEEYVKDLVQTCADESCTEISSKNDEIHSYEVEVHPSEIPEARQIIICKEEYNPLIKEMQLCVGNLDQVEQATGEVICPTLMAEVPGVQILPADSCHESMSLQGKAFLHPENESQDGVCATSELNGENQAAIDATGCPLENAFVVKESALNLCQAKETLNKDLYLEMGNTSNDDGNANIADQFMKLSMEKCDMRICSDIVKPSTESPQEGSAKVQKLETHPDSSSVDICNLGFNLEKEMADLSSSNTDDKTSFGSPSDANIHENDHQKTRKVATIQPMPQNVNFVFKVHYITQNDSQIIAVTGDHEKLGKWESYVPLTSKNGGFWSDTITLPADTSLAWKFVMVENGKIKRWEECNNRFLKTAHEDIEAQLWWGYP